jgi:two-component system sensor histidine kinase YesM
LATKVLKRIWQGFQYNIKLRIKLILTYSIIVVTPIIVLGIFLTTTIYKMTLSDRTKTSNVAMNQIRENITSKLLRQKNIIDTLITNVSFMNYLNTYYEDDYLSLSDYMEKISPIIEMLNTGKREFVIKVYSKNRTIGFSGEMNNHIIDLEKEGWYDRPNLTSDKVEWTGLRKFYERDTNNYIGCYRNIFDYCNKGSINAVVAVFINEHNLYSLISEEKTAGNIIFLLDDKNRVVTTTEQNMLYSSGSNIILNNKFNIDEVENGSIAKYNGRSYLFSTINMNSKSASIEGWRIVYLAEATRLLGEIRMIWVTSLVLSIVCIIISLIIIIIVSESINRRISNLIFNIKKVFGGDYKIQVEARGSDEIAVLQNDFNSMIKRIDMLIHEVYEAKLEIQEAEIRKQSIEMGLREAELKALQRQINPHYLFNTLEAIRMNLVLKEERETANIIKIFAETFRMFVYGDKKTHTIREELDFIDKYMTIQNYRFINKIKLICNIPDELMDYEIPKLLIQPLVENAVSHGIEQKGGTGTVQITISRLGDIVCIAVSDDGIGMDKGKLDELKSELCSKKAASSDASARRTDSQGAEDQEAVEQNIKREKGIAFLAHNISFSSFSLHNKSTIVVISCKSCISIFFLIRFPF